MKLTKPTIALFDMDGTTVRHVNPRMLGALEFLDDASFKFTRFLRKNSEPYEQTASEEHPRLLVHRAIHKFRRKPVEQIVQPCPGIYLLLNFLKDNNVPIGIVSNGLGKGYGHDILDKFQLSGYYKAQIFREDIARSKPHPDPILRALKAMKDPLSEDDVVWYIGDRHKDIVAALAADTIVPAKIIPFAYGLKASIAVLEKGLGPEHIIMNYTDFTARILPLFHETSTD